MNPGVNEYKAQVPDLYIRITYLIVHIIIILWTRKQFEALISLRLAS